ncbi:MAG TPA: polyprenyl synthetase family protein [Candidatus Bathyarchaeia archaeon]|nr:polyprenyl synthetase family protein [Candidatus Bathyarchaeia archaeon]
MTRDDLQRIVRIGKRVDPLILRSIALNSSPEFRPSLQYHFRAGGKRVRAAIVILASAAAGGSIKSSIVPATVVEMIHNYSLVMDDIIDHGDVRRGVPTARAFLGDSIALLAAMYYREILDKLIQRCNARENIRRVAVDSMCEIIDGERLDLQLEQAGRTDPYLIAHRVSHPIFPTYLEMIGRKTASLFRAAGQIGGYSAKANDGVVYGLGQFGWKSGLAFQVMDDVLDICGKSTGKQPGKDIIEHKLGNAVILVAIRFMRRDNRRRLMRILQSRRVSPKMARAARSLIGETPAENVCREIAGAFSAEAKEHLSVIKDSSSKRDLELLCDEMVNRSF